MINNKVISLSLITAVSLVANSSDLGTIEVSDSVIKKRVENVYVNEVKSADVAEALSQESSSIELIRRSGIANDILLRGQKKDNIVVTIDNGKIHGACPNRMDPPTSHIVTNNIESIEVVGGPFDVENTGTLSGQVKVKTKDPKEGVHGEMNINFGSYGYTKSSGTFSGGNDMVKVLVSASDEKSDQYEDGSGNTLAKQLINTVGATHGARYKDPEMDAYNKKTFTSKVIVTPTDNIELKASVTQNRSEDILYPSSTMDANYDDSNLYTFDVTLKDLSSLSKDLTLQTYQSDVQHLMSTEYRAMSGAMGIVDAYVETEATGVKLKNSFDMGKNRFTVGIDTSSRNWKGYKGNRTSGMMIDPNFIPDVDTMNNAMFVKSIIPMGQIDIEIGVRYDDTNVKANEKAKSMSAIAYNDIDFSSTSANIQANLKMNDNNKIYFGLGRSYRVPDAKELFMSGGGAVAAGDLEQTQNTEFDLGFSHDTDTYSLKTKLFYSSLKDYIYYHYDKTTTANSKYENIDASIYGLEVSSSATLTETLILDAGINYQRGEKDEALDGQSDKDLADITPLKVNIALTYDDNKHRAKVEAIARDSWDNYDSDNGEQKLNAYGIINAQYNYKMSKNFDITIGMDNIFDKTYAMTNTYKDLTLAGTADGVMLINEPGRYTYTNLRVKF